MQTELYSLFNIFNANLFRIPDYQRGYSWSLHQLKDFWTDLVLLDLGRDHYTGVLTLEQVPSGEYKKWTDDLWIIKSKRFRPYYVVDGQQRLTTSLILIQCLIESMANDDTELNYTTKIDIKKKYVFESKDKGVSRSYIFGYEKDDPSYEFLKTQIFLEASDNHNVGEQTIYTENLIKAKQFFTQKLEGFTIGQLEEVFTKLTQHFLFNIYTIGGDVDVFVAFETMNNRGKPLSHLELLKNRLIFLSTRLGVDTEERSKVRSVVNEAWKSAYHYMGKNKNKPLNDDVYLKTHFVVYFGSLFVEADSKTSVGKLHALTREDGYKDFLLESVFTSRNIEFSNKPRQLVAGEVDNIKASAIVPADFKLTASSIYEYAHSIKSSVELYHAMLDSDASNFPSELKLALARLSRIGWSDALSLGLSILVKEKHGDAVRFFEALERFIFLRILGAYFPTRQEDSIDLLSLAVKHTVAQAKIDKVIDSINEATRKISSHISFVEFYADEFRMRSYYAWRSIKYFLFEYELELKRQRSRAKRDKVVWEDLMSENYENDFYTVEHIYPQKPKAEYWRKHFPASLSAKQKQLLRNSLGNLVPLSQPKNSALGNKSFPDKKNGSEGSSGYAEGSYSEMQVSRYQEWTPMSILDRGLKMLSFMEKRWKIDLGDDVAKTRILGLEFLTKIS